MDSSLIIFGRPPRPPSEAAVERAAGTLSGEVKKDWMEAFEISQLMRERGQRGRPYLEFLRTASLSAGVYELQAGASDPQQPHSEDEVYYVIGGSAFIRVGEEDREVGRGSIIFVNANVEHRFHTITEDLTVLVFFAPAEYSLAPGKSGTGD